jgi:Lon protease-like protein
MFPLGSVLVPGAVLPLHVFEPRYRALVRSCLDSGEPEFGVVLIERGSEVGGGDERRTVGVVARMLQVAELDDGRYAVVAVGTRRIAINAWLPDDPYPLADVDDLPEAVDDADRCLDLARRLWPDIRRLAALAVELGDRSSAVGDVAGDDLVDDDAVIASYQVALGAPVSSADLYDLLCAPGPLERLLAVEAMLPDVAALQQFRLGGDDVD